MLGSQLFGVGASSMLRRNFIRAIGCTVIAWSRIAMAQQSSNKVWRIAHIYPGKFDNPSDRAMDDVFRGELRELGYRLLRCRSLTEGGAQFQGPRQQAIFRGRMAMPSDHSFITAPISDNSGSIAA